MFEPALPICTEANLIYPEFRGILANSALTSLTSWCSGPSTLVCFGSKLPNTSPAPVKSPPFSVAILSCISAYKVNRWSLPKRFRRSSATTRYVAYACLYFACCMYMAAKVLSCLIKSFRSGTPHRVDTHPRLSRANMGPGSPANKTPDAIFKSVWGTSFALLYSPFHSVYQ